MAPKNKFDDILNGSPFHQDIGCPEIAAAMSASFQNLKESSSVESRNVDTQSSYQAQDRKSLLERIINKRNDHMSKILSRSNSLSDTSKRGNSWFTNKIAANKRSCPKIRFNANIIAIGTIVYLLSFIHTTMHFHKNLESDAYNNIYRKLSVIQTKFATQGKFVECSNNTSISSSDAHQLVPLIQRPMILAPENDPEPVEWNVKSDTVLTQLNYPIFMPSMPKSGTTSLWKFFQCGGQKSSHNWIKVNDDSPSTLSGMCIQNNIKNGLPPFHNCGDFDVYTDTGYLTYAHDVGLECYFPSIEGLEALYHSYPNSTFVHVVRDSKEWYMSLQKWSHSSLFIRFRMCNTIGFPNGQSDANDFYEFYDWHNALIRQFVNDRPSINYIEVQLEDPNAGQILQDRTGISKDCWKQCRPDSVLCEQDKSSDNQRTTRNSDKVASTGKGLKFQKNIGQRKAIPKQMVKKLEQKR